LYPWTDLRHYGVSGSDGGIDIHAVQPIDNGATRSWVVQCRRYARVTWSTLRIAVDDAIRSVAAAPDVLLVVVPRDVSRVAHERYVEYAAAKGVKDAKLWTGTLLEARLYSTRSDLLYTYFGISKTEQTRAREAAIVRHIALKARMRKDLLGRRYPDAARTWPGRPYDKFARTEVIIRSIDDSAYPDLDSGGSGPSSWFKVELYDFYHNGLEVILNIRPGAVSVDGRWAVLTHGERIDDQGFRGVKLWHIGRIPWRNMIEYDLQGDEFYPMPHLYCVYADQGTPYEAYRFAVVDEEYQTQLDPGRGLSGAV
jgi:hypothetical protein